jgi:hypothetical protein
MALVDQQQQQQTVTVDNVDAWNEVMNDFLSVLPTAMPSRASAIKDMRVEFNELKKYNVKKPLELFMGAVEDYIPNIMRRDETFMLEHMEKIPLICDLQIHEVWNDDFPEQNKEAIWSYINILASSGLRILTMTPEMYESIQKVAGQYAETMTGTSIDMSVINQKEVMDMAMGMMESLGRSGMLDNLFRK